jgi:putative addiction module component (TIGR02574 family)
MSVTSQDILALNTEEKIRLAEALWQSIEKERAHTLTPVQRELLDKRLAMHRVNPLEGKSWDEIKNQYFK